MAEPVPPPMMGIGADLAKALVNLQAKVKPIKPNAVNGFLEKKYVDLLGVYNEVQPLLKEEGLAVVQMPSHIEGKSALRTIVIHESGQYIEDTMPMVLPEPHVEKRWDKDSKQYVEKYVAPAEQDQGKAITYLRRYAYMSALGLVSEEDNGADAGTSDPNSQPKFRKPLGKPTYIASTNKPPSRPQMELIRTLAKNQGFTDEQISARLAEITNSAQASATIEKLQEM